MCLTPCIKIWQALTCRSNFGLHQAKTQHLADKGTDISIELKKAGVFPTGDTVTAHDVKISFEQRLSLKKTIEIDRDQVTRIKIALSPKSKKEEVNTVLRQFETEIQLSEFTLKHAGQLDFETVFKN